MVEELLEAVELIQSSKQYEIQHFEITSAARLLVGPNTGMSLFLFITKDLACQAGYFQQESIK